MRHVMFDPFGSSVQGFDLGANQQQRLESNVRQARAQDYDYNVLNPYRLAGIQRNDVRDNAALPFDVQHPAIQNQFYRTQLAQQQLPLDERIAMLTGITQPFYGNVAEYGGFTPSGINSQGQTRYVMHDANGQPHWVGDADTSRLMQQLYFPQQMQGNLAQAQINNYNAMAQYGRYGIGGYIRDLGQANYYNARAGAFPPMGQPAGHPLDPFFAQPQEQPQEQPQQPPMQMRMPSNAELGTYGLGNGGYNPGTPQRPMTQPMGGYGTYSPPGQVMQDAGY